MSLFLSHLYTICFLILCLNNSVSDAINGNETDRLTLLEFKKMVTHDPLGVMLSWNSTTHFCHWYGVSCGRRHQRVTALDLSALNIAGSLSPHIGNLSFLRLLQLDDNSFSSAIPQEIGYLHRLVGLLFYNNSLSGSIPSSISNCTSLEYLDFGHNNLGGEIPSTLGHLSNLKALGLGHNKITGMIPPSLGNLSFLSILSIPNINLFGAIPNNFVHLRNLKELNLQDNMLTGLIHPSIYNLSFLELFFVGMNQIQGNLPSNLGITLPNLQVFEVAMNDFTGNLPYSVSNASNLKYFEVQGNKFTGQAPSFKKLHNLQSVLIGENSLGSGGAVDDLKFLCSLTNDTNLEFLDIAYNNFGGLLPQCISNITTSLKMWSLGENQISGNIPTWIGNLISLEVLHMSDNPFSSGEIPYSIGNLTRLHQLDMSNTNLHGNIPDSVGYLSQLAILYLENNNLQGRIPLSLTNCRQLLVFDASQNNLSGAIPSGLSSLVNFNVSDNKLTGTIPVEVANLNLEELDVSKNMLSGTIPSNLGGFGSLQILFIQDNSFYGQIPSSLRSLRGLQFVDFSSNNLSGEIPDFLTSFDLQYLNLSNNNFEGKVPIKGIFANSSATSVVENSKLCGGIPEFRLPKCKINVAKKSGMTQRKILIISASSCILVVFLLVSLLLFCLLRKKRKQNTSMNNSGNSLLKVSYGYLIEATQGFSSANLVGVGSFGSVYKGILDQEKIIAVKVFNLLRKGASKSFVAECEALRNIRHRNLVKVLTVCSGIDYHGNDFKALVYEFMANGSLNDWLHPPIPETNDAEIERKSLSVVQRLNISIDIACALEYLHYHCEIVVVHCDLKPSNVLLDEELTGHVSDFGLAKLLFDDIQNSTTNMSSSFGFRGTVGYAPPEYGIGNEVWTYGDVYSYGILLLEMFTGKRPTDEMFKDGLNLHVYVDAALPERVVEIIDPIILSEIPDASESLISVFRVGIACSLETASARMNMSDVVAELCSIRNKLLARQSSHPRRQNRISI